VFGDWNDAFMQKGEEATRKAIYDAIRPPAESPLTTMSEAEFTAMSASEKAMRVHEHYGEALAVDANGQLLSRYENGIWKIIPPSDFARDVAGLFQRLRAPFSSGKIASVVETLKLIIPQQDAPARRLIGFATAYSIPPPVFQPAHKSHWLRTLCDVDFTRRWKAKRWKPTRRTSGAGSTGRPVATTKTRRDSGRAVYGAGEPLRLAALSRSDRPRRQREKYSGRNCDDACRGR
jgi:phage/plasmid-associated DNA primase